MVRNDAMEQDDRDAAEVRLNRLLNLILETALDALGFSAATVTTRHDGDLVEWNASTNCGRSHTPATGAHGRRTFGEPAV
jgi:hypothetical protein